MTKHAFALFVLIALAAIAPRVHAQAPPNRLEYGCQIADNGCSKASAGAQCAAFQSARDAYYKPAFTSYTSKCVDVPNPSLPGYGYYQFTQTNPTFESPFVYVASECGAYGYDAESPGGTQCLTQQKCLARNAGLGDTTGPRPWQSRCVSGCMIKSTTPMVAVDGTYYGNFQYSGDACGAIPTIPKQQAETPKDQECTPASGGMTFCVKKNGEQCYTSSNGRQTCWTVGETGVKNDNNVQQKRDAGTTPKPPNLQLPNGDTLVQSGTPRTQTTTITNTDNTTRTITTTTTNYVTQSGTNVGDKNEGESNTGDGSGKDGDDEGSAEGGGDCETPPITSGDPVMGMVATQAWSTRCAVEAGNAATVSGDIGNCSQPFSVEGTNANAQQLRAMRAQICPQGTAPDPNDYSGEAGDPGTIYGEEQEIGADGLDMSGLGFGNSCPAIPTVSVMGRTIAFDTSKFCDWMHLGGVFVRIVAALWCLRVIGGA